MLGCETRAEIDAAIKAIGGTVEKHKGDFRVASLRERLLASYRARIAEFKRGAGAS